MPWDDVVAALHALETQIRLIVVPGHNGSTIIDDSYNASPASVLAALSLLAETPGRHIAVLGDMLELGSQEEEGHLTVGREASEVADHLIVVGRLGRLIGEEALRCGMPGESVRFGEGNEQVVEMLKGLLRPGDHVLVKGSRGLRMEEIVRGLKA
jgi:UDP-N-acetylmuramoyl-tripeptide--D-alanyl-D-alanine ligase